MTKWTVDPAHSEVSFKVKHLMITNVKGTVKSYELEVITDNDQFLPAEITFSADAASIDTGNEQRDQHLQSPDFFDAANYPRIAFRGTRIEKKGEGEYELTGELTIRDITRPVKLDAEYAGIMKDPWGNIKAGFTVTGKFNRKDWGLGWNAALETGGMLVSEEVRISADIQLTR
jgi:polyisoprenoid-binding protein YceI